MADENLRPRVPVTGITARELYAKSDNKIAREIVKDQTRLIDAEIQNAHSAGFNQITYELPENFHINSMSKKDAQILVYSEILMAYRQSERDGGKGFQDTTIIRSEPARLRIRWMNGMDAEERDQRNEYIDKCSRQTSKK